MSKMDRLKIAAVIVYMLNPLGILAFGHHLPKTSKESKLAMARHQFQSPKALGQSIGRQAASSSRGLTSSRSPASSGATDYSCLKHLKQ